MKKCSFSTEQRKMEPSPKRLKMVYSGSPEPSIITYVKGVDRRNTGIFSGLGLVGKSRQNIINKCSIGDKLILVREPNNPVDKNAIKVCNNRKEQIGHISRNVAKKMAELLDAGANVDVEIMNIIDRYNDGIKHCLIEITVLGFYWDEDRNPIDMTKAPRR